MSETNVVEGETLSRVSLAVANALAQARAFGYLGPGPLQTHIDHAHGFGDALESGGVDLDELGVVDLGSGGGIPGLVLAERWPESRWCFVDSHQRRMSTLRTVLAELGWDDRTTVWTGRAEEAARDHDLRGSFSAVVARGFAGPAVTAECASGFLAANGLLVVSEPPTEVDRWDDQKLGLLGLHRLDFSTKPYRFFVAQQIRLTPPKFPRAVGIPGKTPLF